MAHKKHNPGCPCCGGCGTVAVTVIACTGSTPVSGAAVTVYDATDAVVGTGTTDASGFVSIGILAAGSHRIKVEKSGFPTSIQTRTLTCSANAASVFLGWLINVTVRGCNSLPAAGATVTATFAGITYHAPAVTDSAGLAQITVSSVGTHTISVVHPSPRFVAYTGTAEVSVACAVSHVATLAVASGYVCANWGATFSCLLPIATTLYLTDPAWGAVTLVYDVGTDAWQGFLDINYPACDGCAAVATRHWYVLSRAPSNAATNVGNRATLRATLRNHTAHFPDVCIAAIGETPIPGWGARFYGIASRTCPTAFLLTSTTLGPPETYCGLPDSVVTITE